LRARFRLFAGEVARKPILVGLEAERPAAEGRAIELSF
jgi:hypothetical protein